MADGLRGKVALVTGAAGHGMGRSTALTLAREGAVVAVNYRTGEENAQAVVEAIRAGGGTAAAVQADVNNPQECARMIHTILDDFGGIDICVINPGAGWHPEPVSQLSPTMAVDDANRELAPLYNLMPLVLPGMYTRRWGRLIAIAMNPAHPSPAYSYNAAKAARMQAMLQASVETWKNGVTANVIAPGPVAGIASLEEAVTLCARAGANDPQWSARSQVTPQDIAEGIAFLCAPAGQFINGCVLPYAFH